MKKLLLLVLALGFVFVGFSQTRKTASRVDKNVARTAIHLGNVDEGSGIEKPFNLYVERPASYTEIQLGTTVYDKQSNGSLSNRFHYYDDGTMAFVWTRGTTPASYSERGTAYNYFDGSSWGAEPTARVETVRTGWPSYAPLGANGEVIICHQATDLVMSKRDTKGTGAWNQSFIAGPGGANKLTWPRICTGGPDGNSIHLLVNSYAEWMGQATALLYYRSLDAGATWDITQTTIPGTGADKYFDIGADSYVWAEPRANTLAFLLGDTWTDLNLFKSTDNGTTWTKTTIWEHPYPLFDWNTTITTDTIWAPESISLALDYTGKAHVAFGIGRVAHTATGTSYSFWPYTDGIGYWNEDMPPFAADNQHKALDTDTLYANGNLAGWSLDLDGSGYIWDFSDIFTYNPNCGISTFPSISVDVDGNVFLAYSSVAETFVGDAFNYKHIFLRARMMMEGVPEWGYYLHVNDDPAQMFDEAIYPLLTLSSDDNVHMVYNVDEQPGLLLNEDEGHLANQNRQLYSAVPKIDFGVGLPQGTDFVKASVSANYPNPFKGTTNIDVNMTKAAPVSIRVTSISGQEVSNVNYGAQAAGPHVYKLDGNKLSSGVYFYTVTIGNQEYTNKMIVK